MRRIETSAVIGLSSIRALALANNKQVAVIGYTPPIVETDIATADGVFRPIVGVRSGLGTTFQQVQSEIESFGSPGTELREDVFGPLDGPNQAFVEQTLRTGGRIEAGVGTSYLNVDPVGTFVLFNPAWRSTANIAFEQPLFRGRGPVATQATIRIAQANHDQSWHTFRATLNTLLRDVESAYWTVQAAQRELATRSEVVDTAARTLDFERERLRVGEGTLSNVAQAEEQLEHYRAQCVAAENRLAASQRELRRLAGIHPGDRRPLVPLGETAPPVASIDFSAAVESAMQRPELLAQQSSIQAAEIDLARQKNGLQPNVSIRLGHSMIGLDDRLDQSVNQLSSGRFNAWNAGLVFRRSLGQPQEQAAARRAELSLSREQAQRVNLEHEIRHELDAAYQNLVDAQRLLEIAQRRREAAAQQREARQALYAEQRATLLEKLDAENRFAEASIDEITAQLNVQRAATQWNFARGVLCDGIELIGERKR